MILKQTIDKGCKNEDGSFVFTDIKSLRENKPTIFSAPSGERRFSVKCNGFAAILTDQQGGLIKFACTGFKELILNGEVILCLEHPAGIFVDRHDSVYQITVTGKEETNKFVVNKLQ